MKRAVPFTSGATAPGSQATSVSDWRRIFRLLMQNGVHDNIGGELAVSADGAGLDVQVAAGRAWVEGFMFDSDAQETLSIAANASGSLRIDRVILRLDVVAESVDLVILQGTPGAGAPALTQSATGTWEISLAQVSVASGATSIANGDVTDQRTITAGFVPSGLFDAAGDLLYGSADNTPARLPLGSALQVLRVNAGATAPEWTALTALATNHTVPTDVNIVNTSAQSNAFTRSIAGGTMGANGGGLLLIASGDLLQNIASNPIAWKLIFGATEILTSSTMSFGQSSDRLRWMLIALLQNRDATNSQIASATMFIGPSSSPTWPFSSGTSFNVGIGSGIAAEDSTAAKTLSFTADWTTADPNSSFRTRSAHLITLPARS